MHRQFSKSVCIYSSQKGQWCKQERIDDSSSHSSSTQIEYGYRYTFSVQCTSCLVIAALMSALPANLHGLPDVVEMPVGMHRLLAL